MKRLFIIKTGTTFPATAQQYGDFDEWTRRNMGGRRNEVFVVDVEHGDPLPDAGE
ncbi:MAG: glutamine amidotransferase, partial [Deltaproteobacteria bacterium]|nr:glutamine amidotransferase [Deltaproteobacteria bacterium]